MTTVFLLGQFGTGANYPKTNLNTEKREESMWWNSMTSFEHVYWIIAIAASTILIIQFVIACVAGLDIHGGDVHTGSDLGAHGNEFGMPHFQLLTIRNIVAFFAIFGWSGLAFYHNHVSSGVVIVLSFLCGLAMMAITAGIFYFLSTLQSTGNVDVSLAKGQNATVYLPVPPSRQGTGKIEIVLQGKKNELNALTNDTERIPTGASVKVIEISNNQAIVERI
jgi:hypothetical protein